LRQFSLKKLILLIALIAIALVGARIYQRTMLCRKYLDESVENMARYANIVALHESFLKDLRANRDRYQSVQSDEPLFATLKENNSETLRQVEQDLKTFRERLREWTGYEERYRQSLYRFWDAVPPAPNEGSTEILDDNIEVSIETPEAENQKPSVPSQVPIPAQVSLTPP
jgi:hypothetical protein